MKKLLLFTILIIATNAYCQESNSSTQTKVEANRVYDTADRIAVYPGGIEAFRRNFYQTFDGGKINGKGRITSEAMFVIDQNGLITEIVTKGDNKSMNKEMERAIKAMSKTKWSPATIDGEPVKYRFRFPIAMNL